MCVEIRNSLADEGAWHILYWVVIQDLRPHRLQECEPAGLSKVWNTEESIQRYWNVFLQKNHKYFYFIICVN